MICVVYPDESTSPPPILTSVDMPDAESARAAMNRT